MGIKIVLLVVFFAVMVGVGIYSRKHASSVDGFVLGSRSVGPWLTAFAYGTSYFSAVVFVGYAGQFGWKYGIACTWIGIGNALIGSLLAWVVLGRRTKVMTQHLKSKTMPDFFGERYDSKSLKIVASVIVFVFLIPYTASVYNGLSRLFGMAFNIPYSWCVVAMAVFTAVYVILGGYMATAINDFIQGIIMLVGIVAVIAAVLSGQGGFMEAVSKMAGIPSDAAVTAGQPGAFTSFFGPDPLNLLGVVILTSLGTWGLPQMIGKLFDGPEIYDEAGTVVYDSIIPHMLSSLPDILIGIVVVLVLSASMSTLSSLVLTSSSTMTLDLLKDNVMKHMSEKKQIIVMQLLIVFFIVVSVVIALDPPTFIAQLMGISWGALAGAFLAPFLYGLYWKGVTKAGVWAGFIAGVGLTVSNMFIGFIESPINAGAAAMIAGLVAVPVVSLLTPKMKKDKIEEIFQCYDETVTITKKRSLQQDM